MIWRGLALSLVLAGCQAGPAARQESVPLRNPTAPVASQINVGPDRVAGSWQVIEAAGMGFAPLRFENGITLNGRAYSFVGDGRYEAEGRALWVHWLDGDNRVMALGDPSGRRVAILARAGQGRADLVAAARKVLAWYGYDLSRLRQGGEAG